MNYFYSNLEIMLTLNISDVASKENRINVNYVKTISYFEEKIQNIILFVISFGYHHHHFE